MTPATRAPRFERIELGLNTQITNRDREVLRFVAIHRFVRSTHIAALIEGSHQNLLRRLQRLFHLGYLNRPRSQIEYYHRGGSRELVYSLTSQGAREIRNLVRNPQALNTADPNIERFYLEHALMATDIAVKIDLASRHSKYFPMHVLHEDQISHERKEVDYRWHVNVTKHLRIGISPDRVIQFCNPDAILPDPPYIRRNLSTLFIEADRGTMPITRAGLDQTSIFRKMLAYHATWAQGIHRSRFGIERFRVLIVTTSKDRVRKMIDACQQLERGHRLFLFVDHASLITAEDPLALEILNGKGEADCLTAAQKPGSRDRCTG